MPENIDTNYIKSFREELIKERESGRKTMKMMRKTHIDFDIYELETALELKEWIFVELMLKHKKSEKSEIEEYLKE